MNYATQGQYPPGSTFKITSTAAAVADGFSLNGLYNCPATVTIGGRIFANDGEPNLGPISFREALIQSCDTVYYNLAYQMWQTDDNKANFQLNPNAPTQKMQQMELDWGFGNYTGDRPAGRGAGHHPHPPVAVQHVRGQRPQGPELVQEREGERLLRPADRVRRLPERLGLGAGPGGHRRDRPGLRDLDPAAAHERLHRARRRRHALQPAGSARRWSPPRASWSRRSTRR